MSRVDAFDGLRCFLLLALLELHYGLAAGQPMGLLWPLTLALVFFFVLSGFLITRVLLEQPALPLKSALLRFWWRRCWRILPAYYVVICLAGWIYQAPYAGWLSVYLFNYKIYSLSVAAGTDFVDFMSLGAVSGIHLWSMNVEEQFYLLYPIFFLICPPARRGVFLILGLLVSISWRQWALRHQPHACYGILLPVAGEHLLWGCLLAWLDHRQSLNWLRRPPFLYLALFGLAWLVLREPSSAGYRWGLLAPPQQSGYALTMAVIILGLQYNPRSYLTKILAWRPFVVVGRLAYGAYLLHPYLIPPLGELVRRYPGLAPYPPVPLAFIGPPLTLALAAAMWLSFEGPANRLKDRLPLLSGERGGGGRGKTKNPQQIGHSQGENQMQQGPEVVKSFLVEEAQSGTGGPGQVELPD
ncbi:MAG: acyltransferase [Vulcanimicrobiota bacterium]